MSREKTEKQQALLNALSSGEAKGNIKEAMRIAGYSSNAKPSEVIRPLREDILEIARDELTSNSLRAVMSLSELMDNPSNLHAKTILATSKEILDRTGIVKEESVNVKSETGGVVILPPKDREKD